MTLATKPARSSTEPLWHLLQVSDVLDLELASALAETVPVIAWEPARCWRPESIAPGQESERCYGGDSTLRLRQLPLLHGFHRPVLSLLARTGSTLLARLLAQTPDPALSPLICTIPYFAPVAERWPGPVVYWLTDLMAEYSSANRAQVQRLDRRLCRAATLVCPNSHRLAAYLIQQAACDPARIHIVPNATRAANLYPQLPTRPAPRPQRLQEMEALNGRPIAGVIGNLAGNMDWHFLELAIRLTPWLSWVFVGPTTMDIADHSQRRAREAVMSHRNAYFTGRQPYGELAAYARCFEVAVLPYKRCEPTFSGSSTRFYEHLAACRPMIATRGLEELTRKTPLLTLVECAEEAAAALNALRVRRFDDGLAPLRWQESRTASWQARAASMRAALAQRLPTPPETACGIPQPQRQLAL